MFTACSSAHPAPALARVVVHGLLQRRERDAHQHGGQAEEQEREDQIEESHEPRLPRPARG